MRRPVSTGCDKLPMIDVLKAQRKSHQLPAPVRFLERPPARLPHDCHRAALAVSSSSPLEQDPPSQPPPPSSHLRIRYGACRHFLARLDALDGARTNSHHHALRATRASRCLAGICPRRRSARSFSFSGDFMSRRALSLEQIVDAHLRVLATTLRPHTVRNYRSATHRFLAYLHTAFPKVCRLSQLRRDPHLLGWFRSLCDQDPPLCTECRLHSFAARFVSSLSVGEASRLLAPASRPQP